MNTYLERKQKWFWKKNFTLMNNVVLGKTVEHMRKHRDIKLITTERWRNNLVSESNYHTTNFLIENI